MALGTWMGTTWLLSVFNQILNRGILCAWQQRHYLKMTLPKKNPAAVAMERLGVIMLAGSIPDLLSAASGGHRRCI